MNTAPRGGSAPSLTASERQKPRGQVGHADNAGLLEESYEQWRVNPASVDAAWQAFFEGFELGSQLAPERAGKTGGNGATAPAASSAPTPALPVVDPMRQGRLSHLLFTYRMLGHYIANLDPLGFNKNELPELDLHNFKFSEADLDQKFDAGTAGGGGQKTLREILQILQDTYCRTVGAQYMHIQHFKIRRWLRDRMESTRNRPAYSGKKKRRILKSLMDAEQFEKFLHTRYVGQKRFSLEGGETLIPVLDAIVQGAPGRGIFKIAMGMAHRGRLNVLANIIGKDFKFLFEEFSDNYVQQIAYGDGDVKYHLGFENTRTTVDGDKVSINLAPNPSHLEAVTPVVQGKARAFQRLLKDSKERKKVLPVVIHGDGAFIGQGIVAETFNMSQLDGYKTGGTVHIVVNNQIGFTTLPHDARSTLYCTASAKMLDVPIFHVNGNDPVAAVHCIEMALDFRQQFGRDVVVDIVCYRKHGHNEGDEPSFTQPRIYASIAKQPLISEILLKSLVGQDVIDREEAQSFRDTYRMALDCARSESRSETHKMKPAIRPQLATPEMLDPVDTAVSTEKLREVGLPITAEPEAFALNPKIQRLIRQRREMIDGERPVDWGMAETLAYGTLLVENIPVRLSGQDVRRGTFSHRHAVYYEVGTRRRYIPLRKLAPQQGDFRIYNSPLTEAAVLGFEFGYTLDYPNMLLLWEAQFGDFANGAQVIIDQFITSSESKWNETSNIVLLLPHGYEGQGPEHSSGRLERFLQACAEDNIQVGNLTTPANLFHALRRQVHRPFNKPLVLMTPKSLLRDPRCTSALDDFTDGEFREIIPDTLGMQSAKRVVFCTGKVYFDLEEYREKNNIDDAAIVRIEQHYPLHEPKLREALKRHPRAKRFIWCQEESENMGAWFFMEPRLRRLLGREIGYAGRDASASPATGSRAIHQLEQAKLIEEAFTL
ncbi:MAG: 2-oxoglutarate dehydrogenase E1 component [Verrucomicrobia bacterium]|nr:MAG: 2-oxoglutarate dehydrogenase E1 component [Verrucomicrobiota bacterium]